LPGAGEGLRDSLVSQGILFWARFAAENLGPNRETKNAACAPFLKTDKMGLVATGGEKNGK
jgi:hypothetical protein